MSGIKDGEQTHRSCLQWPDALWEKLTADTWASTRQPQMPAWTHKNRQADGGLRTTAQRTSCRRPMWNRGERAVSTENEGNEGNEGNEAPAVPPVPPVPGAAPEGTPTSGPRAGAYERAGAAPEPPAHSPSPRRPLRREIPRGPPRRRTPPVPAGRRPRPYCPPTEAVPTEAVPTRVVPTAEGMVTAPSRGVLRSPTPSRGPRVGAGAG